MLQGLKIKSRALAMHIAILVTNTDHSAFADRHPKDGEKFARFMHSVRPDWQMSVFQVESGAFPKDLNLFDGLLITGSPASIHDDFSWIPTLKELIVKAFNAGQPIFGACFGHQIIAEALGGKVDTNPDGWVFGAVEVETLKKPSWAADLADSFILYAAHKEQVERLPEGAETIASGPGCQYAGYRIGDRLYTTQYHPEMEHGFIVALTEELRDALPDDVIDRSLASLKDHADGKRYAESVARFFETAV
ncbi:MAG: type 1 glutamine amidotransferase [Pseudomonadota bacterium]